MEICTMNKQEKNAVLDEALNIKSVPKRQWNVVGEWGIGQPSAGHFRTYRGISDLEIKKVKRALL